MSRTWVRGAMAAAVVVVAMFATVGEGESDSASGEKKEATTVPSSVAPVTAVTDQSVLAVAKAVSTQVTGASLEGFESVWEVTTDIPNNSEGQKAGKAICEAVRNTVKDDKKNVTVKATDGMILATGTFASDCVSW